jgi:hypothetical protein
MSYSKDELVKYRIAKELKDKMHKEYNNPSNPI